MTASNAAKFLRATSFSPGRAPGGRTLSKVPPTYTTPPAVALDQTMPSVCRIAKGAAVKRGGRWPVNPPLWW
ncbi:hypothetical protein ACIHEJ_14540 [Streptomyces sp. NPDC052301]|uniref:hypothetical protein n=1 Tax=Streptomyces sp. NPDC052301 TaxID=3365687 RepID=UPI0037D1B677